MSKAAEVYTLDANIFIRDFDVRESDYADCHALIEALGQRSMPIIEPALAVAEVAGAISRTRRDPIAGRLAAQLVRELPSLVAVTIDDDLAARAADLAADAGVRGADAVYVAVAQQLGTTLVTLDRELRERTSALIDACTPAEALARLVAL